MRAEPWANMPSTVRLARGEADAERVRASFSWPLTRPNFFSDWADFLNR